MKQSLTILFIAVSICAVDDQAYAAPKKKKDRSSQESKRNLKESFRAIGHGFRDAGRAVGRDAKAATHAVKKSEQKK